MALLRCFCCIWTQSLFALSRFRASGVCHNSVSHSIVSIATTDSDDVDDDDRTTATSTADIIMFIRTITSAIVEGRVTVAYL